MFTLLDFHRKNIFVLRCRAMLYKMINTNSVSTGLILLTPTVHEIYGSIVNQNVSLVLIGQHVLQLQLSLTGFSHHIVNITFPLPDHRAAEHLQTFFFAKT